MIDYDKLIAELSKDKEIRTLIASEAYRGYGYFAEYLYKDLVFSIKYDGDILINYRIGSSSYDEYIRDSGGQCQVDSIKKIANRIIEVESKRRQNND